MSALDGAGDDVSTLIERLGLRFNDVGLVAQAMSHRSWCAENPGHESYERLEFLGDAVLGWVTADAAFRRFPEMSEGQLTGIRKGVVNTWRSPSWRASSASARTSSSARARPRPEGRASRRSSPTRWRR